MKPSSENDETPLPDDKNNNMGAKLSINKKYDTTLSKTDSIIASDSNNGCNTLKQSSDIINPEAKTQSHTHNTINLESLEQGLLTSEWLTNNDIKRDHATSLSDSNVIRSVNYSQVNGSQQNDERVPDFLQTLFEGNVVCGDTYVPFSAPSWFDMGKFRQGQRFAVNHIFGVMYAELLSLLILFAFKGGLEPLIFTGKSDTPFKSFKRYLSTVDRVKSWYEGDIWDTESVAHKNLKTVRNMHESVRKSLNTMPKEELKKKVTLEDEEGKRPMWTDLQEEILDDFQSSCPFQSTLYSSKCPDAVYVNQFDMGLTQFGFAGLVLVFPKMFGIHDASKEDLDAFAHFWRTIGHLLGTDERYNVFNGDLDTVQQRCRDMITFWIKPAFREVSRDWMHMSRCVFKGISFYIGPVTFEVLLMYLCRVLDICTPKLKASLSFMQYYWYIYTIFLYSFVFRLPFMVPFFNFLINLAVKQTLHMSPDRLRKLEQQVYPYENVVARS